MIMMGKKVNKMVKKMVKKMMSKAASRRDSAKKAAFRQMVMRFGGIHGEGCWAMRNL